MYGTPDEIVPLLVQGRVDVALLPTNVAAVLYAKTKGAVQIQAINTGGVLDVVETGTTIKSIKDLKGRTVLSTGKGAAPEYVLNYLLRRNGLEPGKDVTVDFRSESTELATILASRPNAVAVLPQPFVTIVTAKNPSARIALDLTKEWDAVASGSQLVTGVLVVRKAFADANPSEYARFLSDYRASTEFTNQHPAEAAKLIVKAGIVPSEEVAIAAIPSCRVTYVDGAAMKKAVQGYLDVLFQANPASVGGALPGDDFYRQP